MRKLIFLLLVTLTIISCSHGTSKKEETETVNNTGKVVVENGKGITDSIQFECVGCKENLTVNMFNDIVKESTKLTRSNLKLPLSFIPIKMKMYVLKEDSLYNYIDNKKIDSVYSIITTYSYNAKNGVGNELEGEMNVSFYLKDGKVSDLTENIKLAELRFDGKSINRSLTLSDNKENFISITPTKDKMMIVNSSVSCVSEGTWLLIILDNDEEIKLTSWNDFNCDGTSYYYWFNKSQIEKLKNSNIKSVSVVDDKSASCLVDLNQTDYFKQLLKLY